MVVEKVGKVADEFNLSGDEKQHFKQRFRDPGIVVFRTAGQGAYPGRGIDPGR